MSNNVFIIGTGTIGGLLISMLARHKDRLDIDRIMFNKNTPLKHDSAQIKKMIGMGAELVTDEDKFEGFRALGMSPVCSKEEAIGCSDVVVDCTPKGIGLKNKKEYYQQYDNRVKGFIAQGSEDGFGPKFGYNLVPFPDDKFVQVVSCNTHNIAALIKSLEDPSSDDGGIVSGDFVCMRRANDISQNGGFVPGVNANAHDCGSEYGTHHAQDAFMLLKNRFSSIDLFSTAIKLPTQYMHAIRFSITLSKSNSQRIRTSEEAVSAFKNNNMVSLTNKVTSNQIFSYGRDWGLYGRILSQAVVCEKTVVVKHTHGISRVFGVSYTNQDGNSLISSVYAILHFLDASTADEKIKIYNPYIFQEI